MWGPDAHSDVVNEPSDACCDILGVLTGDGTLIGGEEMIPICQKSRRREGTVRDLPADAE